MDKWDDFSGLSLVVKIKGYSLAATSMFSALRSIAVWPGPEEQGWIRRTRRGEREIPLKGWDGWFGVCRIFMNFRYGHGLKSILPSKRGVLGGVETIFEDTVPWLLATRVIDTLCLKRDISKRREGAQQMVGRHVLTSGWEVVRLNHVAGLFRKAKREELEKEQSDFSESLCWHVCSLRVVGRFLDDLLRLVLVFGGNYTLYRSIWRSLNVTFLSVDPTKKRRLPLRSLLDPTFEILGKAGCIVAYVYRMSSRCAILCTYKTGDHGDLRKCKKVQQQLASQKRQLIQVPGWAGAPCVGLPDGSWYPRKKNDIFPQDESFGTFCVLK